MAAEVEKEKVVLLIKKILAAEQENLKTKRLNSDQMVDKIRKLIEEEVRKCF